MAFTGGLVGSSQYSHVVLGYESETVARPGGRIVSAVHWTHVFLSCLPQSFQLVEEGITNKSAFISLLLSSD